MQATELLELALASEILKELDAAVNKAEDLKKAIEKASSELKVGDSLLSQNGQTMLLEQAKKKQKSLRRDIDDLKKLLSNRIVNIQKLEKSVEKIRKHKSHPPELYEAVDKLEELKETCREIRSRQARLASLREIMQLAGWLVLLTAHVFHTMARGGLQPFYAWLADNISPGGRLDRFLSRIPSLAVGLELFDIGLGLLQPRLPPGTRLRNACGDLLGRRVDGARQGAMAQQRPGGYPLVRRASGSRSHRRTQRARGGIGQ